MNVNNSLQGMQQLFSSQEVTRPASQANAAATSASPQHAGSDRATLSHVGLAAAAAPDSDVRMDKVAAVRQALAQGTYNVPASEVAGKMIDQMLGK